jgi:hypothetical protein
MKTKWVFVFVAFLAAFGLVMIGCNLHGTGQNFGYTPPAEEGPADPGGGGPSGGPSNDPGDTVLFTIEMENNFQWGNGFNIIIPITDTKFLGSGKNAGMGDKFELNFEFAVDRDLEGQLEMEFVDNSAAANWWKKLGTTVVIDGGKIFKKSDGKVTAKAEFTLTDDPESGEIAQFCFQTSGDPDPSNKPNGGDPGAENNKGKFPPPKFSIYKWDFAKK